MQASLGARPNVSRSSGDARLLQVVSTFGGGGRWAGQFYGAHNLAVDSTGDLYITETYEGKRVQKFTKQP